MQNLRNEIWKPIEGYEGFYEVSNCGRVKSVEHVIIRRNGSPRPIREKLIHSSMLPNGYLHVTLYKDCKQKHFHVHRLVAKAFIPNPNNLPEINHKDEYKTNNHVDNLEWCDLDILPRLKPRDSWVLTPPHGYLSRLPRLTRTPQRGNALPQNVVSSMQVAVVVAMTHRTSPLPIMQ